LGGRSRRIEIRGLLCKSARPYLKNVKTNRAGCMAQVVEYMRNKHKALNSISSTTKTERQTNRQRYEKINYGITENVCKDTSD
jgi:hypothetical protein